MIPIITREVYIKFPVSQSLTLTWAIHITIFDSRVLETMNRKWTCRGGFLFPYSGFSCGVYMERVTSCIAKLYSVHQLIIDIPSRKASMPDMLNSITQLWGTMKDSWGQWQYRGVKCEIPRRRWNSLLNHHVFYTIRCGKLHAWSKTYRYKLWHLIL